MKDIYMLIALIALCNVAGSLSYPDRRVGKRMSSVLDPDRMIFPDSTEELDLPLKKRHFVDTPPPCTPIRTYRNKNGTLSFRYVDCNNASKTVSKESGSGQEASVPRSTTTRVFQDDDKPNCAKGSTFCTEDDGTYPRSQIEAQISELSGFAREFLNSEIPAEDETLATRVDIPGEETLCDYRSWIIHPTKAQNHQEKWLSIVNHANYTQGIRVEQCVNKDNPCKMADLFPNNYRTKCVQKYQYRQLLALQENGKLGTDQFLFPSCCVCTYSSV